MYFEAECNFIIGDIATSKRFLCGSLVVESDEYAEVLKGWINIIIVFFEVHSMINENNLDKFL